MTREQLLAKLQQLNEQAQTALDQVKQEQELERKLEATWLADGLRREANQVMAQIQELDQAQVDELNLKREPWRQ
jgi:hypothetical protein